MEEEEEEEWDFEFLIATKEHMGTINPHATSSFKPARKNTPLLGSGQWKGGQSSSISFLLRSVAPCRKVQLREILSMTAESRHHALFARTTP